MVFTIDNLCDACEAGDIQTVRDIVTSKEVDINDTAHDGDTPLMWVIDCDDIEVVRYQS